MPEKKIAVLIPALDEELTIAKVVKDFKKELPKAEIYVFDNGSTDRTSERARQAGAKVKLYKKKGKSEVMKEMFDSVDVDIYIMVDADDTYPANEVHKLIKPVAEDEADMVIGSRLKNFQKEEKRWLHNIGNNLINRSVNFCFNTKINDIESGYRAMNRELIKNTTILSRGFGIEPEITIKALENHFRIKEIPIGYKERPKGSKSKLNSFSDGMYILQTILNLFRDYRPMQFFLMLSAIFFAITIGFAVPVLHELFTTGKITKIYTFSMTLISFMISFTLFIAGFITSAVHSLRQEMTVMMNRLRKDIERLGKNK